MQNTLLRKKLIRIMHSYNVGVQSTKNNKIDQYSKVLLQIQCMCKAIMYNMIAKYFEFF